MVPLKPKVYDFHPETPKKPVFFRNKEDCVSFESGDKLPDLPSQDMAYEYFTVNFKKMNEIQKGKKSKENE